MKKYSLICVVFVAKVLFGATDPLQIVDCKGGLVWPSDEPVMIHSPSGDMPIDTSYLLENAQAWASVGADGTYHGLSHVEQSFAHCKAADVFSDAIRCHEPSRDKALAGLYALAGSEYDQVREWAWDNLRKAYFSSGSLYDGATKEVLHEIFSHVRDALGSESAKFVKIALNDLKAQILRVHSEFAE